ncbi:MAG: hypothetical protein ABIH34_06410 [Nanoarchaeota archaeon]
MKAKIAVGLKIPDNTATTAKRTLNKMGIDIKELRRYDYFAFTFTGNKSSFMKKILDVDLIVNANKHFTLVVDRSFIRKGEIGILVQSKEPSERLLNVLRGRLGLKMISHLERGVLWVMKSSKKDAQKAAETLLVNEHFQQYSLLK